MKKSFYFLAVFILFTANTLFISCITQTHEHVFGEWIISKEATEEETGLKERTCSICGYKETVEIATLSHTHVYSDQWTSDDSYHWHAATCGHDDVTSGMKPHTWNEGEITTAATNDTEGVKTFKCTVCGQTKTEVIAKLTHIHNFSDKWSHDATEHWHACSDCKEKGSEANHDWDNGVITEEATCSKQGTRIYTCTVCSTTFTESIEKLEHTFGDYVVTGRIKTRTCSVCGYVETTSSDVNPTISSTASISQDFIFNTDSVGITKINIRRSEWNKMLAYYDYFYKNENNVIAESYEYEKDGQNWKLGTVGLRLRGNTSRFRPQGKDTPTDECGNTLPNASWSSDYYNYAATCSDNQYRQSHFKIDFEPLEDDDRKMSDCMKGVALKRCDSYFSKEIFCYNLFHQYGIWTAPRASQTKVYINIIEDLASDGSAKEDLTDCKTTSIDFGVYEMFEEVNKQSLKGRMQKNGNNNAENAWKNNNGDLWKCSGGSLTKSSLSSNNFGCENILITNADKDKSQWGHVWSNPCYDLKTNKSSVDTATANFQNFITELNNLSDINRFTEEGQKARKDFYEKWFDVDFFIKTYAVDMLCGMDDDYWGNANNYYLYFDNGKNGSGKCYLIPFDYDNTLGSSITGDKVETNPFEWGNGNDRPLMDRLLEVPEYVSKMKAALLEVSSQASNSPWNKYTCISLWNKWFAQVSPYVSTDDMKGWPDISATGIYDSGSWKTTKHYLAQNSENIYEQVTDNFNKWLSKKDVTINFNLNGGTLNGSSDVVEGTYTGVDADFDAIVGTPVREGYEFVGWTLTQNASDYKASYDRETDGDDLTVYASWIDVSGYTGLSLIEIPDSTYEGIKLLIVNMPENHYRRNFYMKKEGETDFQEIGGESFDDSDKYKKIWAYPFVESGKTYEFYVSYSDVNYKWLANSDQKEVTATSGKGEFKLLNTPEFYIDNNTLKWKTVPQLQLGDGVSPRSDDNWDEYYLLEVNTTDWTYQSWNHLGATCDVDFNFAKHLNSDSEKKRTENLRFQLKYIYNGSSYGNLCLVIVSYDDVTAFKITE